MRKLLKKALGLSSPDALGFLSNSKIKTVLDIGANIGLFSLDINNRIPNVKIHAFEPLPNLYAELESNTRHIKNISLHKFALGDSNQQIEMHMNEYLPSSSILELKEHKRYFPNALKTSKELIEIRKLDDIAVDLKIEYPLLVKIDVQGFEQLVLAGGLETIKKADVILIEMCFEELYEGQALYNDLYQYLLKIGFVYQGTSGQKIDGVTKKVIVSDGIFIRPF